MTSHELEAALGALRPALLRFARLQLRSDAAAEDAVQEALASAFAGASRFKGAAEIATWVYAILKNKIVDEIRRRAREPIVPEPERALADALDDLFDERDHWAEIPAAWGDPHASLEQKRFWAVFEACLNGLPANTGRAFMMREFLGLETDEICKELAISSSNCWVLLHRARLGLRECLSQRWFAAA